VIQSFEIETPIYECLGDSGLIYDILCPFHLRQEASSAHIINWSVFDVFHIGCCLPTKAWDPWTLYIFGDL
jgi:hypothetical protein